MRVHVHECVCWQTCYVKRNLERVETEKRSGALGAARSNAEQRSALLNINMWNLLGYTCSQIFTLVAPENDKRFALFIRQLRTIIRGGIKGYEETKYLHLKILEYSHDKISS